MSPFVALLHYYQWKSYKDNHDPQSKSWMADKNAAILHDLMKELKVNLTESQKLQTLYYNKYIKKLTYWPKKSVWLSRKHIKTKKI